MVFNIVTWSLLFILARCKKVGESGSGLALNLFNVKLEGSFYFVAPDIFRTSF